MRQVVEGESPACTSRSFCRRPSGGLRSGSGVAGRLCSGVLPTCSAVLVVLAALGGLAQAEEVVVNDRDALRLINQALDGVDELDGIVRDSDASRRDKDDLDRDLERVEDGIKGVRKLVDRGEPASGGVLVEARDLRDDLEDVVKDIDRLDERVRDTRDLSRGDQRRLQDGLADLRKTLRELDDQAKQARGPSAEPQTPTAAALVPMTDATFGVLLGQIRDASFSDDKLNIVRTAAASNHFTVAQVTALLGAFDFGNDQVEAGVILYPATVDPNNWFMVYAAFTFDSDKDTLRQRLGL